MISDDSEIDGSAEHAKVFLSYSRRDREQAQGIASALKDRSFGVFRDTDDILPTEEWRGRLQELIAEADTIVFLLSPSSAASEVCAWEVEYASSLNKRIAPIVIDDVESEQIPPLLARLNFIFCTPRDRFENAVDSLTSALNTDIDWIREHTRLIGIAGRWKKAGDPSRLLLRGQDIADAESWRDGRPNDAPAVTAEQARFISESRRHSGRRLRRIVIGSLIGATAMLALAVVAYDQSQQAETSAAAEQAAAAQATLERDRALRNLRRAQLQRARFFSAKAHELIAAKDYGAALHVGMSALEGDGPTLAEVPSLEAALTQALMSNRERVGFAGHEGPIKLAVFSHDGARVISAGAEPSAKVWDVRTGDQRAALVGHAQPIVGIDTSPNGKHLATASGDGTARIWDIKTGEPLHVLAGHKDGVASAMFSPDGNRLVTASADGTARVWDAATGRVLFELYEHVDRLNVARFSPDGTRIVTASNDLTARVWDATTGERVAVLHGQGWALDAVFSPDGARVLAIFGNGRGRIFDAESGELLTYYVGFGGQLSPTSFTPDGQKILAAPGGRQAPILPTTEGAPDSLFELGIKDDKVSYATFSPDGLRAATASADGAVRVWQTDTGALDLVLTGHDAAVTLASFSPDGRALLTASDDGSVRVWDVSPSALAGHTNAVTTAGFSLDGTRLVTGGEDRTVRTWDAATGRLLRTMGEHRLRVLRAEFTPEGRNVISHDGSPAAYLWDAQSGKQVAISRQRDDWGDEQTLARLLMFPDGRRLLAGYRGGLVSLFDIPTGERLRTFEGLEVRIDALAVSPDQTRIAAADEYGAALVWKVDDSDARVPLEQDAFKALAFSADGQSIYGGCLVGLCAWNAETGAIRVRTDIRVNAPETLIFSADRRRAIVASREEAAIFDVAAGKEVTRVSDQGPDVNGAAFLRSDTVFVTFGAGKAGGIVRLWDAETGEAIADLMGHTQAIHKVVQSPDGSKLLTLAGDDTPRLWSSSEGTLIATLEGHSDSIRDAAFSPDGRQIVTASNDGTVRLWRLPPSRNELLDVVAKTARAISPMSRLERCRLGLDVESC